MTSSRTASAVPTAQVEARLQSISLSNQRHQQPGAATAMRLMVTRGAPSSSTPAGPAPQTYATAKHVTSKGANANPNSVLRRVAVAADRSQYYSVQPPPMAAAMSSRRQDGGIRSTGVNNPAMRRGAGPTGKCHIRYVAVCRMDSELNGDRVFPAPATPAIPQSQEVKQFIKEPSYSTMLQLQQTDAAPPAPVPTQPLVNAAAVASRGGPIYANYTALGNYVEMDGLRSSESQGSMDEELLSLTALRARAVQPPTAPPSIYNSPPSPVSSSYSELRQATKYPPGKYERIGIGSGTDKEVVSHLSSVYWEHNYYLHQVKHLCQLIHPCKDLRGTYPSCSKN